MSKLTLKLVKAELATLGISIHKIDGEYKVYPKGTIGQAYFTDHLDDARGTGLMMSAHLNPSLITIYDETNSADVCHVVPNSTRVLRVINRLYDAEYNTLRIVFI